MARFQTEPSAAFPKGSVFETGDLRPGGALERLGVTLSTGGIKDFLKPEWGAAFDAAPGTVTTASNSIPGFLTSFIDPQTVEVLFTPLKAADIMGGEQQKGTWADETAYFPMMEMTGETASYGDWNNNGATGANYQFPQRQQYRFQTISQWGELQLERMGQARIQYANDLNRASVMVLNRFLNYTYFYGVNGLANYGLLNDPSLPAAITPYVKAAGGTGWAQATPNEVYADIQKLFGQLVTQSGGLVEMDARMVLAIPPISQVGLTNANSFNVNVADLLKKSYPNIRIETAVQYITQAGNMAQLFVEDYEGIQSAYPAYGQKLRAHPVIMDLSAFKQKKSASSWGTIDRRPFLFASMLGI